MKNKNYTKADGIWLITNEETNNEKIADVDTDADVEMLGRLIYNMKDDVTRFLALHDARSIALTLVPNGEDGFMYTFGTNHDFINKLFEFVALPTEKRKEKLSEMEEQLIPLLEEIREGEWLDRKMRLNKISKQNILNRLKKLQAEQKELENLLDDSKKFVLR